MTDLEREYAEKAICMEWGISVPETYTEQYILDKLTEKIAMVISQGQDAFYRLMYRLDISEKKLSTVRDKDDVARAVAKLIYDRQLQKAHSRAQNPKASDWPDADLYW